MVEKGARECGERNRGGGGNGVRQRCDRNTGRENVVNGTPIKRTE